MDYYLIGAKLGHSYSKIIHERIGLYKYDLKEIAEEDLEEFFLKKEFKGLNVTIPYKEKVLKYLDEIDDKAKAIGCVNTIVNDNGVLKGYNTDYDGLKALIQQSGLDFTGKKVLILGNGGTAKTARAVLADLGASDILTVSRSGSNGTINYSEANLMHKDAYYIVNTTPVGMYPNVKDCPAIFFDDFKMLFGVTDVIYNPPVTEFVSKAKKLKIFANNGLYMLVKQAVRASELFTGIKQDDSLTDEIFKELSDSLSK
jgi:shikimate dehydrogenase